MLLAVHLAHTKEMKELLEVLIHQVWQEWEENGEQSGDYTGRQLWNEYFVSPWDNWSVGLNNHVPGFTPSNNPIESWHDNIVDLLKGRDASEHGGHPNVRMHRHSAHNNASDCISVHQRACGEQNGQRIDAHMCAYTRIPVHTCALQGTLPKIFKNDAINMPRTLSFQVRCAWMHM